MIKLRVPMSGWAMDRQPDGEMCNEETPTVDREFVGADEGPGNIDRERRPRTYQVAAVHSQARRHSEGNVDR